MTIKAGINNLVPGATIDETTFTPCGYSMNAILHGTKYSPYYISLISAHNYAYLFMKRCLFHSARHSRSCLLLCFLRNKFFTPKLHSSCQECIEYFQVHCELFSKRYSRRCFRNLYSKMCPGQKDLFSHCLGTNKHYHRWLNFPRTKNSIN